MLTSYAYDISASPKETHSALLPPSRRRLSESLFLSTREISSVSSLPPVCNWRLVHVGFPVHSEKETDLWSTAIDLREYDKNDEDDDDDDDDDDGILRFTCWQLRRPRLTSSVDDNATPTCPVTSRIRFTRPFSVRANVRNLVNDVFDASKQSETARFYR